MNLIYQLLFSPVSRAVGAFLAGVGFVIHWKWQYKSYSYLSREDNWARNNPFEFYCGVFLIFVGIAGVALSYWLRQRRVRNG